MAIGSTGFSLWISASHAAAHVVQKVLVLGEDGLQKIHRENGRM